MTQFTEKEAEEEAGSEWWYCCRSQSAHTVLGTSTW